MIIPSLGSTASEVLAAALNYNTAGYILKFKTVFDGVWHFDSLLGKFVKIKWSGRVPLTERIESDSFDSWLLARISKGEVGIYVESHGYAPRYSKEIHRATGREISI